MTSEIVIDKIIILRKQNYSIQDRRQVLESEGDTISLDAINDILYASGFAPLPRRTKAEKLFIAIPTQIPTKIGSPQSGSIDCEG